MGPELEAPAVTCAPTASSVPSLRARAWRHALWTLVPFLLVWLYYTREAHRQKTQPDPVGLPRARLLWYREHRNEIDLLWLGDSRTYCAMDPEVYDPLLGRHSQNMAVFGLWLPAQWSYFEDLLREVPRGTTICWSIGHINFNAGPRNLETMYPLGLARIVRYLWTGYRWADVRGNLYNFATWLELPRRAAAWRDDIDHFLAVPLRPQPAPPAVEDPPDVRSLRERAEELLAQIQTDPLVAWPRIVTQDGRPTSVENYTKRGAYRRYEIDESFFRRKQAEMAAIGVRSVPAEFEPEPLMWTTFERILDLMAASGCKVIVNEIEEAPHCYPNPRLKDAVRRFMRTRVRQAVESHGLIYLHAGLDQLVDEDFFDYNHLNTRGVKHYAPLLAEVLRPHLRRD